MELIIGLVSGALGGNAAGALMKNASLGVLGNSVVGILGGGIGALVLNAIGVGGMGAEAADAGLDLQTVLGQVAAGGAGGGVLMAIIGVVKGVMDP